MGLLKTYAALSCSSVLGYLFGLFASKLIQNVEEKYAVERGRIRLCGKTYMLTELWEENHDR